MIDTGAPRTARRYPFVADRDAAPAGAANCAAAGCEWLVAASFRSARMCRRMSSRRCRSRGEMLIASVTSQPALYLSVYSKLCELLRTGANTAGGSGGSYVR